MKADKSGTTVLIIDDEPVVAESIAAHLEDSGFVTLKAEGGHAGLEMFRCKQPDIILIDLLMPEVDGLEVLAAVGKESPETPAIVVSGAGRLQDATEALRLGAWDYISKPIQDMAVLEHAVYKALERADLRMENRKYRENLEAEIKIRTAELEQRTRELELTNKSLNKEMDERRRTEVELRNSEKRYRALFEDSPISLWEEDFSEVKEFIDELQRKGVRDFRKYFDDHPEQVAHCTSLIRIIDVNKATLELYEADSKSDLIIRLNQLMTEKSHDMLKEQLIAVSEGKTFEIEGKSRTLKGRLLTVIIKSSVPPGYEETWSKVFISIHDLTERIRAEKEKKTLEFQLRQAQKMEAIGALAGGIAHDFNNILFPIFGYTQMSLGELPESSEVRENLENVLKSARRARGLICQILDFSRHNDSEKRALEIQPIIKETLKLLKATLPATIEISENIDRDCGKISANPTQIHQVIMNLCTNAYHAMRDKGGVLEVTLNKIDLDLENTVLHPGMIPGSYLKLTINDTGHGMNEEVLEQIFNPYFTTKEPGEGTGLGLPVVNGIIEGHNGHIAVYSELGKGTTFHVYLPVVPSGSGVPLFASDMPLPGGEEKILLIDDEEEIVRMEKQMLEQLGYHVTEKISSIEALEVFQAHPENFDLVITDMTMPKMTGLELSQELIRIRPDIPIILCTGFSELIVEEKLKAIGIREYVMKPVLRNDMAEIIRRVLDNS